MASVKLSDSDGCGAIRILSTESTYVLPDQTAFEQLVPKHPKSPDDRRNVPMARGAPLECTTSEIVSALRSFKPGSAAGSDGLRPQHIQDMVQASDSLLISALVLFINHVLSRSVPQPIRLVFLEPTCMHCAKGIEVCAP